MHILLLLSLIWFMGRDAPTSCAHCVNDSMIFVKRFAVLNMSIMLSLLSESLIIVHSSCIITIWFVSSIATYHRDYWPKLSHTYRILPITSLTELCSWISAWEWKSCQSAIKIWLCIDICTRKCWRRLEWNDTRCHVLQGMFKSLHAADMQSIHLISWRIRMSEAKIVEGWKFQCEGRMLWAKYLLSDTAGSFL